MSAEAIQQHILYFNGLERTRVGLPEKLLIGYLRLRGIEMTHASIDWHSRHSFEELFDDAVMQAEQMLRQHGKIAIVGASAGGSLAINVFQQLRNDGSNPDITAVSLSGRLRIGDIDHLEYSALRRADKKPSATFIDSVVRCDKIAVPCLTEMDRERIRTVRPLADGVVPLSTMGIDGVESHIVPIGGHGAGIALATMKLPEILGSFEPVY